MKKSLLYLLLLFSVFTPFKTSVFGTDYQLNFTGGGATTVIDSIQVTNLQSGIQVSLIGNQSLFLKSEELINIYPNPNPGRAMINFLAVNEEIVTASIFGIDGSLITNLKFLAVTGTNSLELLLPNGIFLINIQGKGIRLNVKTISFSENTQKAQIKYTGITNIITEQPGSQINMKYNEGDRLLFRAYSGNFSTYYSDQPKNSKNIQIDFYACTDASGNHYPVVILGKMVWMAENLRTSYFRNTQSIPRYTDEENWKNSTGPAYCIYDNHQTSNSSNGFLYNWYSVDDSRQISPEGWSIPSDADWLELDSFLLINKLRYNQTSGFNALNSGYRDEAGIFTKSGETAAYWTGNSMNAESSYNRKLHAGSELISKDINLKTSGYSVRCVRPVNGTTTLPLQIFDIKKLPEITLKVTETEWNKLLQNYDQNPYNEEMIISSFSFTLDGITATLQPIGLRLRGNTSRRRPEGVNKTLHNTTNPDWHHASFSVDMNEYVSGQKFAGLKKINLKWFKDDSMYSREVYCYDLFRRFGVWTAPESSYCKLYIHVAESTKPAYFGVYELLESVDNEYLKKRKIQFGDDGGFLWKAFWGGDFKNPDASKMGIENVTLTSTYKPVYDLKNRPLELETAKLQLQQFIRDLNQKTGTDFQTWIESKTDVPLFLKTYAVNVMCGMWDDYWANKNNFYFYFNSAGKFYFIPYDYDNTLGTSLIMSNSGTQNLLKWGNSTHPLVEKIIAIPQYRKLYIDYLHELSDPGKDLFHVTRSRARIINWHNLIKNHIINDTGEDMVIADRPASWGNCSFYRLLEDQNNYFDIRASNLPTKIN